MAMKTLRRHVLFTLVFLVALTAGCSKIKQLFESKAARAYREYRASLHTEYPEEPPYSQIPELMRHAFIDSRIDFEKCKVDGDSADIVVLETTRWMPPNAAGLNFATIVSLKIHAAMKKNGDKWEVAEEEILTEEISTHDDRKTGL